MLPKSKGDKKTAAVSETAKGTAASKSKPMI
jgi:hypothetical protein